MAQRKQRVAAKSKGSARVRPPKRVRPILEVALAGAGVRPGSTPARLLAELLLAATQLVEAFQPTSKLALTSIRRGSAVYAMQPTFRGADTKFAHTVGTIFSTVDKRGEDATPEVRRALLRLVRVGAEYGGVRLGGTVAGVRREAMLAAPDDAEGSGLPMTSVLYGEICGVEKQRGGYSVTFRPDGEAKIEMAVEARALAAIAARMFAKDERAAATVRIDWDPVQNRRTMMELLTLAPWTKRDPRQVLQWARTEIERAGERIDGAALEASIFGEA